jgi:enoyl-CoA hydratase/carnithine racemase
MLMVASLARLQHRPECWLDVLDVTQGSSRRESEKLPAHYQARGHWPRPGRGRGYGWPSGVAFGAGCEITEAAPLAIAAEHATFAKPEIRLGFPPPFGGSQRLPRHVGRKRALEMILTGEPVSAARAAEIGLVNQVVPADSLLADATGLAELIIANSAAAVTACLSAVTRGINLPIDEALAVEASWFAFAVSTGDATADVRRFLTRERH